MTDEIELVDDSRIERYIWKEIGKQSAREMATSLGVSPEKILSIKRDMVESVDAITVDVQRAKLMRTLQELADDAQERAKTVSDERNYAGIVNAAAGAIDKLLKEFRRDKSDSAEAVNSLNALRVRELTSLMFEVVDATVPLIAQKYDIDENELFDLFNDSLTRAAARRDAV